MKLYDLLLILKKTVAAEAIPQGDYIIFTYEGNKYMAVPCLAKGQIENIYLYRKDSKHNPVVFEYKDLSSDHKTLVDDIVRAMKYNKTNSELRTLCTADE